MWGSGDYQQLSGGDQLSWKGSITTFHLGSDALVYQDLMAGLALSWSRSLFDYTDRTNDEEQHGDYELRMWSLHPYAGWAILPWLDVWMMGGYGRGEIKVNDEAMEGTQSSDTQMFSGALGIGVRTTFDQGTALKLKGESFLVLLDVEDNRAMIEAVMTKSFQQRIALEGIHESELPWGAMLIPSVEVALRNDGGDGEKGNGVELRGELRYVDPERGLTVAGNARWLAVHSAEIKEWGVGGFIRFEPGAFWFTLTPVWGETTSSVRHLWEAKVPADAANNTQTALHLDTELGYDFRRFRGLGVVTPYGAMGFSDEGSRYYRIGTRLVGDGLSLSLETERKEVGSKPPEHSIMLRGSHRF